MTSTIDALHDEQNILVTDMIFKWGDIDRAILKKLFTGRKTYFCYQLENLGNYIYIDGSVKLLNSWVEGTALHNNIALTAI